MLSADNIEEDEEPVPAAPSSGESCNHLCALLDHAQPEQLHVTLGCVGVVTCAALQCTSRAEQCVVHASFCGIK